MKKNIILILSILLLLQTGCTRPDGMYTGEHPAESASMQSALLNAKLMNEPAYECVWIIDEDAYGRKMFVTDCDLKAAPLYFENMGESLLERENRRVAAIGIVQKADQITREDETGFVYYYEDINFIRKEVYVISGDAEKPLSETVQELFLKKEIDALKEKNDWGQVLNEKKMSKVKIFRKKEDIVLISKRRSAYEAICKEIKTAPFNIYNESYLVSDKNKKSIYFFREGYWEDEETYVYTTPYLIMFDKNGNVIPETGVMKLDDSLDYASYTDDLIAFKKSNGWDMSA